MMVTWINVKTAATLVGISEQRFRTEWVPENADPQVTYRCPNGRHGTARRIEVDLEDLERVLAARVCQRVV